MQEEVVERAFSTSPTARYVLIAVGVVLAFFAAYGVASGRAGADETLVLASSDAAGQADVAACPTPEVVSACGSGCCGAGSTEVIEASAVAQGAVQGITVDVSGGFFDPNVIRVQAGVPTVIEFGEGSGCMAEVMFKDFAVFENLMQGGATVELPALEPGEYAFSCGMEMVFGTIVAE